MIVGVNQYMLWDSTRAPVDMDVLNKMANWGAQSLRVSYPWKLTEPLKGEYDWSDVDYVMESAANRGMTVLLMLYWAPEWSSGTPDRNGVPGDAADYGAILGMAGNRYGGTLAGIEMWEHPDIHESWAGSQTQYIDLLAVAFPVARDIAPVMTYLAGAPTYLGLENNWFANAYTDSRYRPGVTHDAQAIQPYMKPSHLPPDAPASPTSIAGIADLIALREPHDDSPLWATAFGWSTHPNVGDEGEDQIGVNEIQHAEYTARAYEIFFNTYDLAAAYVYADIDAGEPPAQAGNRGLLYLDRTPKPTVNSLTEVFATRFDAPPEPPPDPVDLEDRIVVLESEVDLLTTRVETLEAGTTP